jgi:hypothetical protein
MKYVGMAVGAVIVYFAWKVSQDTGAMLIAAGWFLGILSMALGLAGAAFIVRAAQPRRGRVEAQPIDAGYSVMPQLPAGKPQPQFRDAGSVQVIGVPQEVSNDAWR